MFQLSRLCSLVISFSLLVGPLPLSAIAHDIQPVFHNQDDLYVYLGKELSNISQVVACIRSLDDSKNSPLDELHTYIEDGFFLARYNSVLEVLEYADTILQSNSNKLNPDQSKRLHNDFEFLVNKFLDGELNINPQLLEQSEHLLVSDNDMALRAAHLRTLRVDENMDVLGKTTLYKHLNCKQGAHIQGKLKVDKSAKFKKNVTINGTLSVTDLVVASCIDSLCVNNLSVVNQIIDSLTITNLSVVNESVSGTLSANNAVIQNLTFNGALSVANAVITNLSATNEIVTNATITNLSVTNCVASLCVNNLSVTNESVSGTLSVNNEIVTNATVTNLSVTNEMVTNLSATNATIGNLSVASEVINCNLTVGCNISMNDSTSAAVGNIIKNGTPFIHNFGTNNTFVGDNAGNFITSGFGNNSAFGVNALTANTTGVQNTAVGANALANNTIGTQNTAVGYQALAANTLGFFNTAVGFQALAANTTGGSNHAFGVFALASNTIGAQNTALGGQCLQNNTTGFSNTAVGQSALRGNTTGIQNTAVGNAALNVNIIGTNNTAVGDNALQHNTAGNNNTAIGEKAMSGNTVGNGNTAVGQTALQDNTTGNNNTAVGISALFNNTIGTSNTAMGFSAMLNNMTGTNNTAFGANALLNIAAGSSNIVIGAGAGTNLTTSESNDIYIGNIGVTAESATIRIGTSGTQLTTFIAGIRGITTVNANAIAVLIDSAGQLGTVSSTRRVKHNIEDMDVESAHIYQLRPVIFAYNSDASETKQYGLIAEEVDEVFPEIVVKDNEDQPLTVQYHVLPVLLLNEIQKQQARLNELETQQQVTQMTTEQMNAAIANLQAQAQQFVEEIKTLKNRA